MYSVSVRFLLPLIVVSVLLFSGCGRTVSSVPPLASPSSENMSGSGASAPAPSKRPVYTLFSPRLVGKGENALLFFAQAADPFSEQSDRRLQAIYASGSALLSTYRLDYGSSTGACFTYGVIVPDTFVLLGPDGVRKTNIIHPSESELRSLLLPGRLSP